MSISKRARPSPRCAGALIEEAPRIFFRPPYVGPAGWIGVEMSKIDDDWLGSLIHEGFNLIALKDRKAGPRQSARRRPTSKRRLSRAGLDDRPPPNLPL
jgi:hypothetical protein